ncbi:RNase H family protein [Cruoricaptor ignavus]|uniref:RNase H family protein n=1 Tax=Cruoricaptor ignavus TaxID=1118202 RepID=UPI00370DB3C6
MKYIYTDSRYVADAINKKWIFGWVKNDFAKVKNPDLWQRFYALMKTYQPTFHWVKGHAGHAENELCDKLATEAIKQEHLKTDEGFEQTAGLFSGS